jgi:uncharacterized delta-60 repeat protein
VNTNGSLDTTFGGSGLVSYGIPNTATQTYVEDAHHVALDANGNIVLAGFGESNDTSILLLRYTPNGTLDASFGTGGVVTTSIDGYDWTEANALLIQSDGRIVVAGDAQTSDGTQDVFLLARYLSSEPQIGAFRAGSAAVAAGGSETLTVSNISDGNPNASITQVAFYYLDSSGNQQLLGYASQASGR